MGQDAELEGGSPVPSRRSRRPRERHIPATTAEMHAWIWGSKLSEAEWSNQSQCMFFGTPPFGDQGADIAASFERLKGPRFWRWAEHGQRAAHDEEG